MPRLNTIPDPSQGFITCKNGMNDVDPPLKLGFNQCQSLINLFPGNPPKPRPGIQDVFADDRALAAGVLHTQYTPYSVGVNAPDGDVYILSWITINEQHSISGQIIDYYLEAINVTDSTRTIIGNLKFIAKDSPDKYRTIHFKFLKQHDVIYCVHDGTTYSLEENGPSITGPIIIYWTPTGWAIRQMGIDVLATVNNVYVAGGDPDYVQTASLWNLRAVVFKMAIYVIGFYDNIYRSIDGNSWQMMGNLPESMYLYSPGFVVFKNQMWVIAGSNVYTSADGINWNTSTALPATANNPACIVYREKLYIYSYNKIFHTSDGLTWTQVDTELDLGYKCILFKGILWMIREKKIYSSTDGLAWVENGTDAFPVNISRFGLVTYLDKLYVIGGRVLSPENTSYFNRYVYESADGITWTQKYEAVSAQTAAQNKWLCEACVLYGATLYAIGINSTHSSTADKNYELGQKWYRSIGGVTAGNVVMASFTFVRRTDPASILQKIEDYCYEPWEKLNDSTIVGTDEILMPGNVQISGINIIGTDTDFTQLRAGVDRIRINGSMESKLVTEIADSTHMSVESVFDRMEYVVATDYRYSVIPSIGDPVTTTVYEPGDAEGPENQINRHIVFINVSTERGRIIYGQPDENTVQKAVAQGATHLRIFRTLAGTTEELVSGLVQGWVADVAVKGSAYTNEKVYRDNTTDNDITANIGLNYVQVMNYNGRSYSPPPLGRYIEWSASKIWIAGEYGSLYCSEFPGGDTAHQTENIVKYASEFNLSEYKLNSDPNSGYRRSGMVSFFKDIIEFFENRIFVITNSDRLNEPISICDSFGCPYPETIVKASHPVLGACIFFVSNQGPAVVLVGNVVKLLTDFNISILLPKSADTGSTLDYYSGEKTDWESRCRVTAHYSHETYWVHFGDSKSVESQYREYFCYGYYIAADNTNTGAFRVVFPAQYEPQSWIIYQNQVFTLSHSSRSVTGGVIYRLTEFLKRNIVPDRLINEVSGETAYSLENSTTYYYDGSLVTSCIPLAARLDLTNEIFALLVYLKMNEADNPEMPLHIKITTDSNRLICEGDYVQERQAGTAGLTTSYAYRYKLMAIPRDGLIGSFAEIFLSKKISSRNSFEFYGAALQVISRNLPAEFMSKIGNMQSTTGALTFVATADKLPETDVYAST